MATLNMGLLHELTTSRDVVNKFVNFNIMIIVLYTMVRGSSSVIEPRKGSADPSEWNLSDK